MNFTNVKIHIRRNLARYIMLGGGCTILGSGLLHDIRHHYSVPQTNDMVRVSEDNDFTIWHDNKRGTTCWERRGHLSCVKD